MKHSLDIISLLLQGFAWGLLTMALLAAVSYALVSIVSIIYQGLHCRALEKPVTKAGDHQ